MRVLTARAKYIDIKRQNVKYTARSIIEQKLLHQFSDTTFGFYSTAFEDTAKDHFQKNIPVKVNFTINFLKNDNCIKLEN